MPSHYRPTMADIFTWLEERRSLLARTHAEMDADQDFDTWSSEFRSQLGARYLSGLPDGFVAKFPPIAKMGVDIGLNNIMVGERAEVKVTLPHELHRDAERNKQETKYLQNCLTALLYALDTYSTESPIRSLVRKSLALGLGVLQYGIAWDKWEDPPFGLRRDGKPRQGKNAEEREELRKWKARRKRTLPFFVRAVHPRNVFFDPHHEVPEDYITEENISLEAAKREYPDSDFSGAEVEQRKQAGSAVATVKRIVYRSDDWWAVYVNQQPVLTSGEDKADAEGVAPNPSGIAGMRMAFGGFGDEDDEGEYVHRIKGIIRDGRDIVVMKVIDLNVLDAMRQGYAFPPLDLAGDNLEDTKNEVGDIVMGPGAILRHSRKVQIGFMTPPPVPAVVFQELQQVDHLLELQFGPDILRGIRDPAETATGQRSRTSIAQGPYKAAKQNCQQLVAAFLQDICYMVKYELREPLTILGNMTLDPDHIPDAMLIEVDFSPLTEEERAFKRQEGQADLTSGVISKEDYIREYRGVEDAEGKLADIRAELLTESILQDPSIHQLLVQRFLEARGIMTPMGAGPGGPSAPGAVPPSPSGEAAAPVQPQATPTMPKPVTMGGIGEAQQYAQRVTGAPMAPAMPGVNGR